MDLRVTLSRAPFNLEAGRQDHDFLQGRVGNCRNPVNFERKLKYDTKYPDSDVQVAFHSSLWCFK